MAVLTAPVVLISEDGAMMVLVIVDEDGGERMLGVWVVLRV